MIWRIAFGWLLVIIVLFAWLRTLFGMNDDDHE